MIFINGRFLTKPTTGVQRYSRELLNALDQVLINSDKKYANISITCLVPCNCSNLPDWEKIKIQKIGTLKGNFWEQIELPLYVKKDLLFSPANVGPLFHLNQVVTIHDTSIYAFPDAYSKTFRLKYDAIFKRLASVAKKILTISEFSKREIHDRLNVPLGRITCVLSGGDHFLKIVPDNDILNQYNLDETPYFLGVSSQSKHKNTQGLIRAFQLLNRTDIKLLLVGGNFSSVFINNKQDLPRNTIHLGYVSDAELSALYRNAKALVFPSFFEGFGLPILEAMSLGCPVICSNTSSLPEVGGDAVLYINPDDPETIADQMRTLLESLDLQKKLSADGKIQANRFKWINTATKVLFELKNLEEQ